MIWGGAEVNIKDSANRITDLDSSGEVVNDIPGAAYDIIENQTEIVVPKGQSYTLTYKGTSAYSLEMKVTDLSAPTLGDAFTANQRAVFMEIPSSINGVGTLLIDLSVGLNTLSLSLDLNNDGTSETTLPPPSILIRNKVRM